MAVDDEYSDAPLTADEIDWIAAIGRKRARLPEVMIQKVYDIMLTPGAQFIDVGARRGDHTKLMARAVGATGRGLAIEADPHAVAKTSAAMKSEGLVWVDFVNVAAFDRAGTATFHRQLAKPGWSSLYEQHAPKGVDAPSGTATAETFEVRLATIDALVDEAGLDACAFMKIDIEHAEIPALKGAQKMMRAFRPIIAFENSLKRAATLNKYRRDDFFETFERVGYVVFDYLLQPMTRERWDSPEVLPVYHWAATAPYDTPDAFAEATRYYPTIRRVADEFAARIARASR